MTFNGISVLQATVVGYQKFDHAALFRVITAQNHFGRDPSAQIICFYQGSSGRTAFFGNNFDFGTSIEVDGVSPSVFRCTSTPMETGPIDACVET